MNAQIYRNSNTTGTSLPEKTKIGIFTMLKLILYQCCGSASIIMRIRDPKNVQMDPDADPDPRG